MSCADCISPCGYVPPVGEKKLYKRHWLPKEEKNEPIDELQFMQYASVITTGQLSLDALKRIIKHDSASRWSKTGGGKARIAVAKACDEGKLEAKKLMDEPGDPLYGNGWPLPLSFSRVGDIPEIGLDISIDSDSDVSTSSGSDSDSDSSTDSDSDVTTCDMHGCAEFRCQYQ